MYYVRFDEQSYVIDPGEDSDDRWRYQGSSGINLNVKGLYRSKISGSDVELVENYSATYGLEDIPTGQVAHAVVVQYQTGDTFGSHEAWCIAAITSDPEKAKEISNKCFLPYEKKGYRSWDGYFEHIKSADVETFIVGA